MSEVGESIIRGLKEGLAFTRGEQVKVRLYRVVVRGDADFSAVRSRPEQRRSTLPSPRSRRED
jgi:hypothetical protein